MKNHIFSVCFCLLSNYAITQTGSSPSVGLFPTDGAKNINPDTHLVLTFPDNPILGNHGQIRVYDAADNRLVDVLDLSIPAGPTKPVDHKGATPPYTKESYKYVSDNFNNANTKPGTPSGLAFANSDTFQLNIIGRFTDAFHFYPVIIHDNIATIYLHNNMLEYDKSYYVQVDSGVLTLKNGSFTGITGMKWKFTTKKSAPAMNTQRITVSSDGSADFNTVQGAIDFIPDFNSNRTTIFIKKGNYEEIVYFKNKTNVTFLGEDRNKVTVFYANSEVFNPHPSNVSTNELAGTFPLRRAAFMGDNSSGIHLINFTIKTTEKGQAEGLLLMGKENIVSNMNIVGSGDAIQINGSTYVDNCTIEGDGDTYLGRGSVFFNQCQINSKGAFMWMRNTSANHGAVLLNCKLINTGNAQTEIARAPVNHGKGYPNVEVVLINCALSGVSPIGWGPIGDDVANVHYWEYNSTNLNDGKLVDMSQRHPASKQLLIDKDAELITNYSRPSFIFDGWTPEILTKPTLSR